MDSSRPRLKKTVFHCAPATRWVIPPRMPVSGAQLRGSLLAQLLSSFLSSERLAAREAAAKAREAAEKNGSLHSAERPWRAAEWRSWTDDGVRVLFAEERVRRAERDVLAWAVVANPAAWPEAIQRPRHPTA